MGTQTTGGAFISIGPKAASLDKVGFEAVSVLKIGEMTDIGDIGIVWNTATHNAMDTAQVVEKKTSFNLQHPSISLAIDEDDTGQQAAEEANLTYDEYTIKITRQNGDAVFFLAQVSGFTVSYTTDSFENGSISLLSQTVPFKVVAVV